MESEYKIVGKFESCNVKMVVVSMKGASCVMSEDEYKRILWTEKKHYRNKKENAA